MRYGIFADIHGNREALLAVLSAFEKENIDAYYCCGDIVGYGADPVACLTEIRNMRAHCVAGNHDWAVAQKLDTGRFHEQAQVAVDWTRHQLDSAEKCFLANLPLVHQERNFVLVHGTLHQPERFLYLMDLGQAKQTLLSMDCSICFVGHSHVAKIFVRCNNGKVRAVPENVTTILPGYRYVVNVGSVGQPRDRDPSSAYCIYDDRIGTIEIKRVAYDAEAAKEKILKSGLPPELGFRLLQGI